VQIPIDLIFTVGGLCAALGAGFGLGVLLGRYVWPRPAAVDPAAMAAVKIDIARLAEECTTLQSRTSDLDVRCRSAADVARRAAEDVARLALRMAGLTASAELALEPRHDAAPGAAKFGSVQAAGLTERDNARPENIGAQAGRLADRPKILTMRSEHPARRGLKTAGVERPNSSRKLIDAIAEPLRARVQPSRKKVETRRSRRKAAKSARAKSRGK
jgi:hypothetical protein